MIKIRGTPCVLSPSTLLRRHSYEDPVHIATRTEGRPSTPAPLRVIPNRLRSSRPPVDFGQLNSQRVDKTTAICQLANLHRCNRPMHFRTLSSCVGEKRRSYFRHQKQRLACIMSAVYLALFSAPLRDIIYETDN